MIIVKSSELKSLINILFFLLLSSYINARNIFFFDHLVNEKEQDFYRFLDQTAEKDISKYTFFKNPNIQLTKDELSSLLINKNNKKFEHSGKVRIYIEATNNFSELKILGFSNIFNIYNSNEEMVFYTLPIIEFENSLSKIDYNKLVKNMESALKHVLTVNKSYNCINTSYSIKNDYKIFSSSYYLFTCPEVYHFNKPFDYDSKKISASAHNFISNNNTINIDYQHFPSPVSMDFGLTTNIVICDYEKPNNYNSINAPLTNISLTISFEFIGLTFQVNNEEKTIWAETKYVFNYLKSDTSFIEISNIYYKESIRTLFTPASFF